MSVETVAQGHPGVWGPGMEPESVRQACEDWFREHPAPEPKPIVSARARCAKKGGAR